MIFFYIKLLQMKDENDLREELHPNQPEDQNDGSSSLKDQSFKNKYLGKERFLGGSSLFSTMFFTWISPLLTYGNKFQVNEKAIPLLLNRDKPKPQFDRLYQTFSTIDKSQREGLTLTRSIIKAYSKEFWKVLLVTVIFVGIAMYQPVLMNQIMDYVKQKNKEINQGIVFFAAIFATNFITSVSASHLFYHFALLGFNLSNALSLLIYEKSLKHPLLTEKQYSVSDIINYSQVDAQRMTYMGFQMTTVLFCPFQIVIGFLLLYFYIGVSFLVGVGIMFLLMIFTGVFSTILAKKNEQLLKAKDKRMKVTEQILQIIKFIKISAQEKYFFKKLNVKREEELILNKKVNLMYIVSIVLYYLSSPLIISFTFLVYTALGNQIDAPKAFTTIILFQVLQYPITQFPSALSEMVQMWTSVKRVEKFLGSNEIKSSYIEKNEANHEKPALEISQGTFLWGAEKQDEDKEKDKDKKDEEKKNKKKEKETRQEIVSLSEQENLHKESLLSESDLENKKDQEEKKPEFVKALNNINVKFPSQCVTMIVGDIGSGKSSLLYAVLSEMTPDPQKNPKITINGSVAFCSQKPWIMSGTVKENILFFLPENQQKLKKVIHFASLQDDLKMLGKGIDTEIGEKGVNLSGGQKARISLARALYSDRDIYLLDDVLSAVDVHVGKFLMEETILGYLRKKTVIMPSHAINFAQQADNIIVMKKGQIIKEGTFDEVFETDEFQEVYNLERKKTEDHKKQEQEEEEKIISELKLVKEASKKLSVDKEQIKEKQKPDESVTNKVIQQLIMPEDHQRGQVSREVYKQFLKASGGVIIIVIVSFCMISWSALATLANIQIQHWCQNPNANNHMHLVIYISFSLSAIVFLGIRVYTMVMSSVKLGRTIHKKMVKSLLYASMTQFYNRVPLGRILNRLSKDLRQIDESIGYALGWAIRSFFSLLSNLVICLYASTPLVLVPMFIIGFICYRIQKYYLKTQRETVRLENITNSPIVSGFTSAVNGVGTIRAYNLEQEFLHNQIQKVDTNKRMRMGREALESWFSMRLAMLTFFINMSAIGYSILSNNQNAALLGLLLTYAMNLNEDIINSIFSYAYMETKMVSVERVLNFTKIQPEIGYKEYCQKWRTKEEGYNKEIFPKGTIEFQNFSAKYRKDLPIILKKINLKIESGEKVGIVGRTGAGKSTLLNCLLRIVDPAEGNIIIDGKGILEYKLKDLRSNLTMIDQEPTISKASFKENLDPSHLYTHEELEEIVKECNLAEVVESKGGLDSIITSESLSVGEKQLLCICRAFLKKSKIVLIDEATANIDTKNDKMIQEVIASKFAQSTVLTIAHRLSTLKNSDKILVLGKGEVLQWGEPKELLKKEGGIYREMWEKNDSSYLE